MADLAADRVPFVRATVVRARRPASARPGDAAVVLADGRIEGFVGGVCAEASVRLHALRALARGEPLLLRVSPDAPTDPHEARAAADDGALTVANPCLSGGEIEIFLEPVHPAPLILVLGESPIARALAALGPALDYDIRALAPQRQAPEAVAGAAAVVVASHGRDEEEALTLAVRAEVPYVALVSSPKRGRAVLESLDLTVEQRGRVHNPAGLWIGARTPGEVALSILAEFIADLRGVEVKTASSTDDSSTDALGGDASGTDASGTDGSVPGVPGAESDAAEPGHGGRTLLPLIGAGPLDPRTAVDPVCGMTVAIVPETLSSDAAGERRWFCREGCRDAFEAEPARYAEAR
jgi:xanthine dehydrogenase accessory factor